MKALQFDATGDLSALRLVELQQPVPVYDEVLVEIKAAGLNPSDVKNVLGLFPYTTLPRIPGRDFAGIVVEGPEPLLGQEVWGSGRELGFIRDGSHAQFMTLPARAVAVKPACLSFGQAAACGVPFITALDALQRCQVDAGTRLLIIGAGAVASAANQLGRALGARSVMAVRRPESLDELRAQGVDAIALEPADSLGNRIGEAFAGEACDVLFDTTGHWLAAAVSLIGPGGRVAVIAAPAGGVVEVPVLDLYRRGGMIVGINSALYSVEDCAKMLNRIGRYFEQGECVTGGIARWGLEQGIDAYRACHEGRAGKVVLVP
ncbi:quinone oxidoreductase family protein [Marinobacterium aestuariivivens]|uniref:Zinc-binding alcohol dehydrogenase family protein n=1 Tax=Marinobacterium aestuariivivens TaxID=1698799 RepID=A0ABW2A5K9_9GAMM